MADQVPLATVLQTGPDGTLMSNPLVQARVTASGEAAQFVPFSWQRQPVEGDELLLAQPTFDWAEAAGYVTAV